MNHHLTDSTLSLVGGVATGTMAVNSNPEINPVIAQIVMPLIGAIVVPFLKDLSLIAIAAIKRRIEQKRKNKEK